MKHTDEELRQTWAIYEKAGYNTVVAAAAAGVSRTTMRDRIHAAKTRLGVTAPKKPIECAADAEERVTIATELEEHKRREKEKHAEALYKDALAEITKLQEQVEALSYYAKASPRPAEWATPARTAKASEHMPYLFTSDAQIGEVIRREETEHGRGYSSQIYVERHRHLISTAIYLAQEHSGSSWKFPGIIYARGGDTISGGIHEELRDTDDLTPIEACELAFEEESAGILKLVETFGRVEVKDCGGGNHDRTTMKPRSKKANAHSYDRLISSWLRREFRNNDRVTFQCTESPDVFFPIYDRNVLLTHGDKIGSRGGHGFIGPAATIMRGAQKVVLEQSAMGRKVDEVHVGHFHQFFYAVWVLCNGCYPGYSEYAKMNRLRPGPAEQTLAFYHPRRGLVDLKRIVLE